ncbi:MAG: ExbD/TolR family protein [Granulosicoccus sp.]
MFEFDNPRPKPSIGLTPLIDVVFILLLFFMLATNFDVERAMYVSSVSGAEATVTENSIVRIHQLDKGSVSVDGVSMDENTMLQALKMRHVEDQSLAVSVSVAAGVSVQSLLELIANTKEIGISSVSIASETMAADQ